MLEYRQILYDVPDLEQAYAILCLVSFLVRVCGGDCTAGWGHVDGKMLPGIRWKP